jgi:hypothetical protein
MWFIAKNFSHTYHKTGECFVGCPQFLGGPGGEREIGTCEGGPDDPLHSILRKVRRF